MTATKDDSAARVERYRAEQTAAGRKQVWVDGDILRQLEYEAGALPAALSRVQRLNIVLREWSRRQGAPVMYPNLPPVEVAPPIEVAPLAALPEPPPVEVAPPVDRDQRILALVNSGLQYAEVAARLAAEGVVGSTGKPLATSTIQRAADRARRRTTRGS